MVTAEDFLTLIKDTVGSLRRSGLIERDIEIDTNTILLGKGSALDSIAFVTFITELEDRLNRETKKDVFIVLNDVHEFNAENPHITSGILAQYLFKLIGTGQ